MSEAATKEKLIDAYANGRMVQFTFPGGRDLVFGIERHSLDIAMTLWSVMNDDDRSQRMRSVLREIKRGTKRVKNGRATQRQADEFAADLTLWLAHELLYSNGEKWLVKGLTAADAKGMFS